MGCGEVLWLAESWIQKDLNKTTDSRSIKAAHAIFSQNKYRDLWHVTLTGNSKDERGWPDLYEAI
jgi:hypothetical protein